MAVTSRSGIFIPIVLLGLFPWSAFLLQAIKHSVPSTWRERHEHRDALFFLLWAGLVFLFFSASSSKLAPYILPVFPPLALLIGRYLAAAWDSRDFPGLRAGYSVFLVASLLLAAAFLVLPYYWPISAGSQPLGIYRYTIAFTLALGGAAAWGLMRSRNLRRAFIAVAVTSALFLTQVNAAAPRVDTKSVKQLAIELKARLRPGDEVASYQEYYQDLPVYLERRITVVDWGGELNFGNSVEDTKAWMIDSAAFWKRWQGPATMYMLTPIENYETLKRSEPTSAVVPGGPEPEDHPVVQQRGKAMSYFPLIMLGVLLNAAAQLFLKEGMRRIGHFEFVWANIVPITIQVAGNVFILGGLLCYVISVAVWLLVLSRVEVSFAYPLLSVGYIVNAVAGYYLFQENLSMTRITGILIICVGVYFVTKS